MQSFRSLWSSLADSTAPIPSDGTSHHWLDRTPSSFFQWYCDFSTFPDRDNCKTLGLRIWFFIGDKAHLMQLYHAELPDLASAPATTPYTFIDFWADSRGEAQSTAGMGGGLEEKSLRDLVLWMISPGIKNGTWQNVQFLDFAYPEPVVVERLEDDRMMQVSIHLSLELRSAIPAGLETKILEPDGMHSKSYLLFDRQLSYEKVSHLLHQEKLWEDICQTSINAAFDRMQTCRKVFLTRSLSVLGLKRYCTNSLSAILASKRWQWKNLTECGYLGVRKENRRVFLFRLNEEEAELDTKNARFIQDGEQTFDVVGFWHSGEEVVFGEPTAREVFESMIAQDGRLKITQRIYDERTEILGRDPDLPGWEVV